MIITYNEENFMQAREEIEDHLAVHAQDVKNYTNQELSIDWDMYKTLQQNNMILFITARSGIELIGYCVYILVRHLHHNKELWAEASTTFVMPAYRGSHISEGMILLAERNLKYKGVKVMTHNVIPKGVQYFKMLQRLGFDVMEYKYAKEI